MIRLHRIVIGSIPILSTPLSSNMNNIILLNIYVLPLIASIIVLFINNSFLSFQFSLVVSIFIFINVLLMFLNIKGLDGFSYFFIIYEANYFQNMKLLLGVDGLSFSFILLTSLLIIFCILLGVKNIKFFQKGYYAILFFTEFLLFYSFSALDLISFFVFFESILIPFFILINIWGSRKEKESAAYKLFIYTFAGSLSMLFAILYIYSITGTSSYLVLLNIKFSFEVELILWLCFFISFLVKIPSIPFHLWLIEAHVEAPTPGSVLLAGILLKLGSYGLIRFCLNLLPVGSKFFLPFILTISIISMIYGSFAIFTQTDLKKIVAYSSIIHMNLVTIGIFNPIVESIVGSIFLMLSHGIVSAGLFFAIGCLYDRYHSRDISYYGGVSQTMPIFSTLLFVLVISNMGFPMTSGFVGEFLIIINLFHLNTFSAFLSSLTLITNSAWSLWFFSKICQGPVNKSIHKFSDCNENETFVLGSLTILTILFGLFPNIVNSFLYVPVTFVLLNQ